MAKKKTVKKSAEKQGRLLSGMDPLAEYGREVWLAGLGALSLARQESTRVGDRVLEKGQKLFDQLVQEGSKLEKETRKNVNDATSDFRGGIEQRVDRVRQRAASNWDKLESVFEERVARALGKLGVPTADEIQELIDEVNKLSREVRELNRQVKGNTGAKTGTAARTTGKTTKKASSSSATA